MVASLITISPNSELAQANHWRVIEAGWSMLNDSWIRSSLACASRFTRQFLISSSSSLVKIWVMTARGHT